MPSPGMQGIPFPFLQFVLYNKGNRVSNLLSGAGMKTKRKDSAGGHIRSAIGLEIFVRDVMTTNILSTQKFESVMSAANILADNNISGLPVVDKKNNVIGIITQADILSIVGVRKGHTFKDLLKHMLGEPLPETRMGDMVGDIMTSPAAVIRSDATIAEAAQIMDDRKIRRLVVVDEKNTLIGLVTRADILKAVIRKLK